jgi:membrane protease YdiL (CAAX protease family)
MAGHLRDGLDSVRATAVTGRTLAMPHRRSARNTTWLLAGLAFAAIARAAVNGDIALTAFASGAAFALVLVSLAVAAGWRPSAPRIRDLAFGAIGGMVLVLLPRLLHPTMPSVVGMRPEPFVAWGLVTAGVAIGEEVFLRGALFDALDRSIGASVAVVVTSVAFALMHVPLYGWQVVPLDLGVGLFFAGLRLATGGVAAPAMAHVLADLSTWWL